MPLLMPLFAFAAFACHDTQRLFHTLSLSIDYALFRFRFRFHAAFAMLSFITPYAAA